MKALLIGILVLSSILSKSYAQDSWEVDLTHSYIGFDLTYIEIIPFHGQFTKIQGLVSASKSDFSDMVIRAKIDVNSISTGSEKRENHLRSSDFFDFSNHPSIIFHSTAVESIRVGKEDKLKITGDLSIRGITNSIELIGGFHGEPINDPWGHVKTGCSFRGSINRQDFGIQYGQVLESGALAIANQIDLILDIVLMKDR